MMEWIAKRLTEGVAFVLAVMLAVGYCALVLAVWLVFLAAALLMTPPGWLVLAWLLFG